MARVGRRLNNVWVPPAGRRTLPLHKGLAPRPITPDYELLVKLSTKIRTLKPSNNIALKHNKSVKLLLHQTTQQPEEIKKAPYILYEAFLFVISISS